MLLGLLSVAANVLSAMIIVRALAPVGPVDALLEASVAFAGHILIAGFALSALNLLNRVDAWAVAALVLLLVSAALAALLRRLRPLAERERTRGWAGFVRTLGAVWAQLRCGYAHLSAAERRLIAPLLFTVAVLAAVSFDLVRNTAPHNWDSMTYHLARMAYYLQHGNLNYFDANYWAQVTHPKNSTVLVLYTYLVSGRNENLTQLVQFIAYGVAILAIYGICRRLGRDRFSSLFAALVFALLTECLMEAITTQNDLLLTAFTGIAVYGLLAFRERRMRRYLVLAGISVGICIGIKSSALLIGPSLAVLAVYALWPRGNLRQVTGDASALVLAGLVGVAVFALPAGYIENWRVFGHPIGPEDVRKLHAFEGEPLSYVLENGTKNLLRFGFEFLSFDGLPAGGAFVEFQHNLRQVPRSVVSSLGLDLEAQEATRAPFQYDKVPASHEDGSYWGILGFGLVWPLVLLALLGLVKATPNCVLALATTLFVLAQAYSGPYDPWRGRYFIIAAVFAVPVLACCVRAGYRAGYPKAHLPWRIYLTVVVLAGCLSAFTAVLGRWNNMPEEVYPMNRLEQLTRNRRNSYDPIRRFDERVPADATVAVCFGEDTFEYPLFGAGLTRTLIPINSFWKGPQPIPAQAGYLLYNLNEFDDRRLTDIHLGEDWYLRKLGK